jgi:hypothetical protein
MATMDKRHIPIHKAMPAALKKSLDKYSVAMQRYKGLLKRLPALKHPPPLPALKNRHHIPTLVTRTKVLDSRCRVLEGRFATSQIVKKRQNPAALPPHIRVLHEPPVVVKRIGEALEDAGKEIDTSEQNNSDVCSVRILFTINQLTNM